MCMHFRFGILCIFIFFYFDNFKTYCSHGSEDICKKTEVQQYSDITDFECVY